MTLSSRVVVRLTLLSFAGVGCNAREDMPRGHGASGRQLAVLAKPQIDMERFFKYTPEQETSIRLLQRPFNAAAKPGPAANDADSKTMVEKIKSAWDDVRFVIPREGKLVRYRAVVSTNIGDLVLDTFETFSPDVTRSLMAQVESGVLVGQKLAIAEGALVFGAPLEKQAYSLPARAIPAPLPKGCLFAFLTNDGRAAGSRFGISLRRVPGGGSKVSMVGLLTNASMDSVLGQFYDALTKKPGSVVVTKTQVVKFDQSVFEGADIRLPRITKDGELDVPDLIMYTSADNPDIHPRDLPYSARRPATPGGLPEPVRPPTIPGKKPDSEEPPPKQEPPKKS